MHLRHVPALIVALPAMLAAQQSGFSDPAREAKLRAAFPAVDRIMRAFTEREHVPGAAWAIVLLVFVVAASSVSSSSKNIQLAQFVLLITLLLPRERRIAVPLNLPSRSGRAPIVR